MFLGKAGMKAARLDPAAMRPSAAPFIVSFIAAIATDSPARLPAPTLRPVLDLNDAEAVARWLMDHASRFEYAAGRHAA